MFQRKVASGLALAASLLAAGACAAQEAQCARMAGSGLCREVAARLVLDIPQSDWTVPPGCTQDVGELDLGDGEWLFFKGARCGGATPSPQISPPGGKEETLRPIVFDGRDGFAAAMTIAGKDPHERIFSIARPGLSVRGAKACAIGASKIAGLPDGAWVLASNDPKVPDTECGPFGAGADGDAYWFQAGRYLFFIPSGNSVGAQPWDPATFNVVTLASIPNP